MIALLLTSLLAFGNDSADEVVWMNLDQARVAAARCGKPILVLVTFDLKTGNTVCGRTAGVDRTLSDPQVEKRVGDFCYVRASDRKTAAAVRAVRALELIFLDREGEELHRADFKDAAALGAAMSVAAERNAPRAVAWASTDGSLPAAAGKLVVLVFADDRKESAELLKQLEDRVVAPLHDRLVFVKTAWKKDGESAKRWGVGQAPALVLVDPARNEVLERIVGRKAPKDLKASFVRALARIEKK